MSKQEKKREKCMFCFKRQRVKPNHLTSHRYI